MEEFIRYFLGVNLLLLLQAVYFRVFLAKQRKFSWNRIFLLGGMLVALLLPLVRWEIVPPSVPNPSFIQTLPEIVITPSHPIAPAAPVWTIWEMGLAAYGLGVAISLGVLVMRNLTILRLIVKGKKERREGYTLVRTKKDIGPASYFRYIFWNEGQVLDPQSTAVAMEHERCHSRQLHSLDLLGVEILKALCWINPAVYMLRKSLRETHELLADQAALKVAGSEGIKQLLLTRQLGEPQLPVANYFYSHIKARVMVLTEKSARTRILHYILVLPLAGLMTACTSLGHRNESQTKTTSEVSDAPVRPDKETLPAFNLVEEVFLKAQMPLPSDSKREGGLTCLGNMPQVLNLDTVASTEERSAGSTEPYLLNRRRIVEMIGYPKEAEEKKITGKVVVKILVDASGHVARYQFIQENDPILRDAVAAHVTDLLFKPGTENWKNAEWWVVLPFTFGMDGC